MVALRVHSSSTKEGKDKEGKGESSLPVHAAIHSWDTLTLDLGAH